MVVRASLGACAPPWGNWQISFDYTRDETELTYTEPVFGVSAAGTSAVSTGRVDVLRDTNFYPVDFGQYRLTEAMLAPVESRLDDLILRSAGSIYLWLTAGSVDLLFQIERSKQRLNDYVYNSPSVLPRYSLPRARRP